MKTKIRIAIAAILLVFTAAFASDIADSVFNRILRVTAKEMVNKEFIASALKSFGYNFRKNRVSFHDGYYQARSTSYNVTFWGKGHPDVQQDHETYYSLRAVLVSSIKHQLHSGTTLLDVYDGCRKDFRAALAEESPEFRLSMLELANEAVSVFEKVKSPEFRLELQELAFAEDVRVWGLDTSEFSKMLAENAKPEEIVEQIKRQQRDIKSIKVEVPVPKTRDRDLEKFALRRFGEGDEQLVAKYKSLAILVRDDIQATLPKTKSSP
jgi:hypothetical protein